MGNWSRMKRNEGAGTVAEKESGNKFARGMSKPVWMILAVVLVVCAAALWGGAQWRPQPVEVERPLPADGFSY